MPDTYYDLPFIYVYNGDALTDLANYSDIAQPFDNISDFILRRIAGVPYVAAKFRYRDINRRNRSSALHASYNDILVVPELRFTPDSQLTFDLETVGKGSIPYVAVGSVPNYYSQIAFQGVRRYYGQSTPETSYRAYDKPFTITQEFTVSQTGRVAPAYQVKNNPVQYNFLVEDYDFELQAISMDIIKAGRGTPTVCDRDLKITLYDPNQQALSNAPVLDSYITFNAPSFNSAFPTPTLLYPANSIIRFDIESLLVEADVPAAVRINFIGMKKYPC